MLIFFEDVGTEVIDTQYSLFIFGLVQPNQNLTIIETVKSDINKVWDILPVIRPDIITTDIETVR